jgi:putative methionine-R-sulfoxide reductase with GAF domain
VSEALDELTAVLARETEADDALRAAVAVLARFPGAVWAGIAFVEDGELVLGPVSGDPDEARRTVVPISYAGDFVGELRVDGGVDPSLLERAAILVSEYVLIGWDTGGEAWEP